MATQTQEIKIPALPLLEPLSKATSTTLSPVALRDTDFLEIDVDKQTGEDFICKGVCLKKANTMLAGDVATEFVQVDGETFVKDERFYNYPSYNASITWFRKVPERKQISYGTWKLAGTDFTALVIHHVWKGSHLIFRSEEAALLYEFLLKRFLVQSKSALIAATWKTTQETPTMPDDFIEHPTLPLAPYQKVALLASITTPVYSLLMEQGTGKTAIVVNRICYEGGKKRKSKKGMYRALVVCPRQVRRNWVKEHERFATTPGKVADLRGDKLAKIKELIDAVRDEDDCCWSTAIISIDSIDSIWEAIGKVKWDLVVIDESHKIKSPKTKRFKTVMKIDDVRTKSKMILTGTPITNTVFDLWAQFEWLGKGLSGFKTFSNFRSFHGRWESFMQAGTAVQRLIGFQNVPLIQERLARLAFLIRKKDANLNLPEKLYDVSETEMTAVQAQIYKKMATRLVVEIDELMANATATGQKVSVDHVLTKLLRLAQICSGHIKLDDAPDFEAGEMKTGAVIQIGDTNPKVEDLITLIREQWESDPNCKFLVWACFVEDMRVISERLAEEGINHVGYHPVIQKEYRVAQPELAEERLNSDDNCMVFVGNPASAGVGLNMLGYDKENPDASEKYVGHEVFFSCNWSAVDRIQAEDRAHRRGTRSTLQITDLLIPNTIDEEIRNRVTQKRQMALTIQDVKDILQSILRSY